MTWTDIASLIAAIAFAVLVLALAYPLYQLGRTFQETSAAVVRLSASAEETVAEATSTLHEAGEQLKKVDTVTSSAGHVAQDVSAITTLVTATVGSPLIKLNAFSHSVRALMRRQATFKNAPALYRERVDDLRSTLVAESGSGLER